jgi:alpha-tubulin suppressor-like RCC1 family protein
MGPNAADVEISSPAEIPLAPVTFAASGGAHTCASTTDGVWCWGANYAGQLGNGQQAAYDAAQPLPTRVIGLAGPVVALSANTWHTCAIIDGGSLQCWGDNAFGELGTHAGDISPNNPVAVEPVTVPLAQPVTDISLGLDHTCARLADSSVWCWGHNGYGQSGGAIAVPEQAPLAVITQGATGVSSGAFHTCARMDDTSVQCWGSNSLEQLGVLASDVALTSTPVIAIASGAANVSAGGIFTCSTTMDGDVRCWGSDLEGALGDGVRGGYSATPRKVLASSDTSRVSAGLAHACATHADGRASCWGFDWFGVLGFASNAAEAWAPSDVANLSADVRVAAIEAGGVHTCALDTLGQALCWGSNDVGQLGGSGGWPSMDPVLVPLPASPQRVAAGNAHSCAVFANDATRCWGAGASGQLGTGFAYPDGSSQPLTVKGPNNRFVEVALGYLHTCGRTDDGQIFCWGDDSAGQIGDAVALPSTTTRLEPTLVTGLPGLAVAIAAGGYQSCAVLVTGALYCWGALASLELATTPQLMSMFSDNVKTVVIGNRHFCAILAAGNVECLGQNDVGQTGNSQSPEPSWNAFSVPLPGPVVELSAGDDFTCARIANGETYCWGSNTFGELGYGEPAHRSSSQVVVGSSLFADGFDTE